MGKRDNPVDNPEAPAGGELVQPSHGGGLIKRGSKKGEVHPGQGRPPSAIREKMRMALDERIKIAEAIADDPEASKADRLRALDLLAKYGLGTKSEVTGEDGAPIHAGVVILPALRKDG